MSLGRSYAIVALLCLVAAYACAFLAPAWTGLPVAAGLGAAYRAGDWFAVDPLEPGGGP